MDELAALFPGKLRFVWHDFPLDFHERARPAARAGREAYAQKGAPGFWQMHRELFGLGGEAAALSEELMLQHGTKLGLDPARLKAALSSTKYDAAINAEITLGASVGIQGTPAYVFCGYLVTGMKPLHYLERVVTRCLSSTPNEGSANLPATALTAPQSPQAPK
jgi:protein-disulfide isomerase